MRPFKIFLLGFAASGFAYAQIISMKPISSSKVSGEFRIADSEEIQYSMFFEGVKHGQRYALFAYSQGNCSNFSKLEIPNTIVEGKIRRIQDTDDSLISGTADQNQVNGGLFYFKDAKFHNFEFEGKIFVLQEVDNQNRSSGKPVACGTLP